MRATTGKVAVLLSLSALAAGNLPLAQRAGGLTTPQKSEGVTKAKANPAGLERALSIPCQGTGDSKQAAENKCPINVAHGVAPDSTPLDASFSEDPLAHTGRPSGRHLLGWFGSAFSTWLSNYYASIYGGVTKDGVYYAPWKCSASGNSHLGLSSGWGTALNQGSKTFYPGTTNIDFIQAYHYNGDHSREHPSQVSDCRQPDTCNDISQCCSLELNWGIKVATASQSSGGGNPTEPNWSSHQGPQVIVTKDGATAADVEVVVTNTCSDSGLNSQGKTKKTGCTFWASLVSGILVKEVNKQAMHARDEIASNYVGSSASSWSTCT